MSTSLHEEVGVRREREQQEAIDREKGKATGTQIDVQEHTHGDDDSCAGCQTHWRPGVKERFPWLGFAALFTVLVCIGFTAVILVTSNGKAKEEWPGTCPGFGCPPS